MISSDSKSNEIKPIRCAIYTRKSTSEGSEQDFTSLDAQREAGANYIASQKSQGWITLEERYDDYGFTGANMERPALGRLIADINAGKIDCVVVYKVDRLSRSLLDFTKILQLFENKGVTFVSVTQHFNTNSSMGRLTLNILLSFAQFEREIISERTRDKLSAAKKKGKFVGGRPSLGYDVDKINHRLVINTQEAPIVQEIFELYLKERSLLNLSRVVDAKGYRTKKCLLSGKPAGNIPFTTKGLHTILTNIIYTGRVKSDGDIYPGEHERIISDDIFNKVQKQLHENCLNNNPKRLKHIGLLSRLFFCTSCQKGIYYSYVRKQNYNYTSYLCVEAQKRGYDKCPTGNLNAQRTDDAVINALKKVVPDKRIWETNWNLLTINEKREIFQSLVKKVEYDGKNHVLRLTLVDGDKQIDFPINLKIPLAQKEETIEDKIRKEPRIRQVLLLAHHIQQLLDNGKAKDLKEIALWLNVTLPRAHQYLNFLRLAPEIQEEIILSDNPVLFEIPEHKIRKVYAKTTSTEQIVLWRCLSLTNT